MLVVKPRARFVDNRAHLKRKEKNFAETLHMDVLGKAVTFQPNNLRYSKRRFVQKDIAFEAALKISKYPLTSKAKSQSQSPTPEDLSQASSLTFSKSSSNEKVESQRDIHSGDTSTSADVSGAGEKCVLIQDKPQNVDQCQSPDARHLLPKGDSVKPLLEEGINEEPTSLQSGEKSVGELVQFFNKDVTKYVKRNFVPKESDIALSNGCFSRSLDREEKEQGNVSETESSLNRCMGKPNIANSLFSDKCHLLKSPTDTPKSTILKELPTINSLDSRLVMQSSNATAIPNAAKYLSENNLAPTENISKPSTTAKPCFKQVIKQDQSVPGCLQLSPSVSPNSNWNLINVIRPLSANKPSKPAPPKRPESAPLEIVEPEAPDANQNSETDTLSRQLSGSLSSTHRTPQRPSSARGKLGGKPSSYTTRKLKPQIKDIVRTRPRLAQDFPCLHQNRIILSSRRQRYGREKPADKNERGGTSSNDSSISKGDRSDKSVSESLSKSEKLSASESGKAHKTRNDDYLGIRLEKFLEKWDKNFYTFSKSVSKLEQSSQHFRLSGQLAPKRESRRQEEENVSLAPDLQACTDTQGLGGEDEGEDEDPSEMSPSNSLALNRTKTNVNMGGLERILNGPLAQNNPELLFRQSRARLKGQGKGAMEPADSSDKENEMSESFLSSRSKTMPSLGRPKMPTQKVSTMSDGERLRNAKEIVEKAVKYKKIFTIQGGYSTIRNCLRRRGWVEKFYKIGTPPKKTPRSKKRKISDDDDNNNDDDDDDDDDDYDDDDDDDDNDQPKIPPWEEDDGIYGIMSRMVRNVNPSLFWVLKRDAIDYRFLNKDQMVNHYCKAGSFTTKVGLCVNMKNVAWFDNTDYDSFFPRCYRLSHDEDKMAFIDDYRLTACMSIVKVAIDQQGGVQGLQEEKICTNPECTRSRPGSKEGNKCVCSKGGEGQGPKEGGDTEMKSEAGDSVETLVQPKPNPPGKQKKKKKVKIPGRVLETAVYQCEKFLASKEHDDIDLPKEVGELTDQQWDDLIQWYYQLVHEEGKFSHLSSSLLSQCESLNVRLSQRWPQFEMDGTKNVWIVKPGAKSRGRGIICYEKLEDMLKLVSSQVVKKDGKYVVQKYMERPLLVYNTKFDIRQWFLVTDWNPLTLYFYRDSYLRFCSQQFTLDDFDQSIHLSNNAIQKHYKNGPRSSSLPDENMWTHYEFKDYLASKNQPDAWDNIIYPAMKRAIICALLVTQDLVEYRKASFELYGADFMLTEDLKPWLIEINSSPSMESSTAVTSKLCTAVLDDTLKVVVDRRFDKNCDIGAFELAFKQPVVTVPPYIGINLCVEGQPIRRPQGLQPRNSIAPTTSEALFTPRTVTMRQTNADRSPLKHNASQGLFGGSNSAGPNLETSTAGVNQNHHHGGRRENRASTPEAVSSSKSLVGRHQPRDVAAKVGSFRSAPGQSEKVKLNQKAGGNSDQSESADSVAASPGKPAKSLDSGKKGGDSCTVVSFLDPANSGGGNPAVPRVGDGVGASDLTVHNGPPSGSMRVLPNTPYLAGLNQRRYISKTSVSNNYTIPPGPSSDRGGAVAGAKSSSSRTLAVNNVESTDLQTFKPSGHPKGCNGVSVVPGGTGVNGGAIISLPRACAMCGRGGNLHLAAADPNCRCQQDSVLITSSHNGVGIDDSKPSPADVDSIGAVIGNVSKPQAPGKQRKSKAAQLRKATSVTPTHQGMLSITDGGEPHSPNTEPDAEEICILPRPARPLSASTVDQCLVPSPHRPNAHHRKLLRKSAMASTTSAHPPDSVFNPQQSLFHTQQQLPGSSNRHSQNIQGLTSTWQALASSTGPASSMQELLYSPLHPLFHQRQPPSYRRIRSGNRRGFRGSMYTGGKIAAIGGGGGGGGFNEAQTIQKSAPSVISSVKLWTNMGFVDPREQWWSPLAVVAQRRARLKQPK